MKEHIQHIKKTLKRENAKDSIEKELLNNTELLHEIFKQWGNMYAKIYKK